MAARNKNRYQRIRSRIALQAKYGTLEFNWLLGRDLVEKKAEQRWGAGVVEQLSLDMRTEYPDIKGFSSRNLWYMKQWYFFYRGDALRLEKLHQLGAELLRLLVWLTLLTTARCFCCSGIRWVLQPTKTSRLLINDQAWKPSKNESNC